MQQDAPKVGFAEQLAELHFDTRGDAAPIGRRHVQARDEEGALRVTGQPKPVSDLNQTRLRAP
jgi:hypothetical protein